MQSVPDAASTRPLTLLCVAKLAANQLERHLEPLDRSPYVDRIILVRQEPAATRLRKVENINFRADGTLTSLARTFRHVDDILRRETVDWVLGFNPLPWGLIGLMAASRRGVPTSLSFIGLDYKRVVSPMARPLLAAINAARLITVTGERMRQGLAQRGIPEAKIKILPHAIDTDRFAPGAEAPDLDVLSVGQLIPRKRMDVLIDAVALLRDRGRFVRAGILGKGPLHDALERQIRDRRVEDRVELLGYRDDVEVVLRRAKVFALVSRWEGVPFAMIEAMCSGLVPVMTNVGTIGDWIEPARNGHLVPVGDAAALADSLERLLADRAHYDALRAAALTLRNKLSLEQGAAFWQSALADAAVPR